MRKRGKRNMNKHLFNGFYKVAKKYNMSDTDIVDLYKYAVETNIVPNIKASPKVTNSGPTPMSPKPISLTMPTMNPGQVTQPFKFNKI